jgi:hypothetical protein
MTKMKLWLIKPRDNLPEKNPWSPWYDKTFGFVIRAESEEKARKIAHKNAGDEINEHKKLKPWLDPSLSQRIKLTKKGKEQMILKEHRAA